MVKQENLLQGGKKLLETVIYFVISTKDNKSSFGNIRIFFPHSFSIYEAMAPSVKPVYPANTDDMS